MSYSVSCPSGPFRVTTLIYVPGSIFISESLIRSFSTRSENGHLPASGKIIFRLPLLSNLAEVYGSWSGKNILIMV